MLRPTQISIPTLVRVKENALDRLGIYLSRSSHPRVAVFVSQGLAAPLQDRVKRSLREHAIEPAAWNEITDNDLEAAARLFVMAMALFAEGAIITNATGWKIKTRDQLRWFINSEIWLRDSFSLEDIEAHG